MIYIYIYNPIAIHPSDIFSCILQKAKSYTFSTLKIIFQNLKDYTPKFMELGCFCPIETHIGQVFLGFNFHQIQPLGSKDSAYNNNNNNKHNKILRSS